VFGGHESAATLVTRAHLRHVPHPILQCIVGWAGAPIPPVLELT